MDEKRVRGLMGLCVRARQATFGEDGCLKTVRGGHCGLLLLDRGASPATREKYRGACAHAGVPLRELPQGLLGEATGRPGMAMALQRGSLTDQLLNCLPAEGHTDHENQPRQADKISGGASVE